MQQHNISTVFCCFDRLGVDKTIPVRFLDFGRVESWYYYRVCISFVQDNVVGFLLLVLLSAVFL